MKKKMRLLLTVGESILSTKVSVTSNFVLIRQRQPHWLIWVTCSIMARSRDLRQDGTLNHKIRPKSDHYQVREMKQIEADLSSYTFIYLFTQYFKMKRDTCWRLSVEKY